MTAPSYFLWLYRPNVLNIHVLCQDPQKLVELQTALKLIGRPNPVQFTADVNYLVDSTAWIFLDKEGDPKSKRWQLSPVMSKADDVSLPSHIEGTNRLYGHYWMELPQSLFDILVESLPVGKNSSADRVSNTLIDIEPIGGSFFKRVADILQGKSDKENIVDVSRIVFPK